jgi:acyl-CoA thioester hydrolase
LATNNFQQVFSWPVRVYYEDTDAQGLVYFANYFKFMERARSEWLRSLGFEQDSFMEQQRRFFVVVNTQARFIVPAKFNEMLAVTVRVIKKSRATFEIEQNIYRKSQAGVLLCSGQVKVACLNADTLKPVRLPDLISKES